MAVSKETVILEFKIDSKGVVTNVDQINSKLKQVGASAKVAQKGFADMNSAAGIAGSTVTEFGRLVSDLPYGIQGVANNLSQLGSMFTLLTIEAAKMNNGLSTTRNVYNLLLAQIQGPVGLLVAFQGLIAGLEYYTRKAKEANKELEQFNQNIVFQTKGAGDYLGILEDENVANEKKIQIIRGLASVNKDLAKAIDAGGDPMKVTVEYLKNLNEEFKIREKLLDLEKKFAEEFKSVVPTRERYLENEEKINKIKAGQYHLTGQALAFELESLEKQQAKIKEIIDLRVDEAVLLGDRAKVMQEAYDFKAEDFSGFETGQEVGENFIDGLASQQDEYRGVLNVFKPEEIDPFFAFIDPNKLEEGLDEELDVLYRAAEKARRIAELNRVLENDDEAGYYELKLRELQSYLNNEAAMRELSYEDYESLKLREKQLENAITDTKINNAFEEIDARQQIIDATSNALGGLSGIFGEATAASKGFALAQIAFDTATGFSQGLAIAQQTAKGTGPLAAFAFPIFYASQVAAVVTAVKKAKDALSAAPGGGSGGVSTPSAPSAATPTLSALPAFNVVGSSTSQLAQILGAQGQQPIKTYVVAGEVSSAQSLERNRVKEASI